MCDPMTMGGLALSGASAFANSQGASAVSKARQAAIDRQRARQAELDAQAAVLNNQSRGRYDNFGGQQGVRGQQLGDYFAGQNTAADKAAVGTPASGSNVVNKEAAKQGAKAAAFGGQQAASMGNLRSFGDLLGDVNRGQARDASAIGQIGNFKAGEASLLPYALDSASHAGDSYKMFGDIAGGLGRIGTGFGLSGMGMKRSEDGKTVKDPWSLASMFG